MSVSSACAILAGSMAATMLYHAMALAQRIPVID